MSFRDQCHLIALAVTTLVFLTFLGGYEVGKHGVRPEPKHATGCAAFSSVTWAGDRTPLNIDLTGDLTAGHAGAPEAKAPAK